MIIMDNTRREFFRNLGSKTAGIAAAGVAPAMLQLSSLSDDIKKLAGDFNQKLERQKVEISGQLQGLANRLDNAVATAAWQQAQLTLIFFLLLVSFAIDAGLTFSVAGLAI